ncbi:hypothetical protein OESDEN_21980 [Oesophagostomum dentatum]|uniref:Uncharacterized protein n=1 Tax=Oesophagostomum dentatum TaxID=61180 RepID=A0A0B1S0C6_OESDE|nr:hypothetical protein OESDEN_21980 [Oesophagostomum dentatum]
MESLIDRALSVFIRRSKLLKGACYKGSRDYETDVNWVDEQGTCQLVTICVCELQVPSRDSDSTQNIFYLCRVDTSCIESGLIDFLKLGTFIIYAKNFVWAIFGVEKSPEKGCLFFCCRKGFHLFMDLYLFRSIYRGWIPGGTCRILKELPYEQAFNPRLWYPYPRFPVEQDEYAYSLASKGMLFGDLGKHFYNSCF